MTKEETVKEAPKVDDNRPVKKSPSKFRLLKIICLGLIIFVVLFVIAGYLLMKFDTPPIIGKVMDDSGQPIDGATIVGTRQVTTSRPDGLYRIALAKPADSITVSAIGYGSITTNSKQPVVSLKMLTKANVRVVVVDPNHKELKSALVVRLDPNTSAPVEEVVTDKQGTATFLNVLSGKAVFVVLHPNYGVGWVETAVDPGGYVRPLVKLEPVQGNKSSSNGLIKTAYAQENKLERNPNALETRKDTLYEFSDVRKLDQNLYEVSFDSRTMVAVSYNRATLGTYIDFSESINGSYPNRTATSSQRIHQLLMEKGFVSPVETIRIVPTFQGTSYQIDPEVRYGFDPKTGAPKWTAAAVDEIVENVYLVKVNTSTADTTAFIERTNAIAKKLNDPSKIVAITNWAELPAAQAQADANGGAVRIDPPHMTVCCRRPEDDASLAGNIPLETSSTNSQPSAVTVRDVQNKKIAYTYNPIENIPRIDFTPYQEFLSKNPKLEFTQNGRKVSMLDIGPPNPDDAPADFLFQFFDSTDKARSQFKTGSPEYLKNWKEYLSMKMYNASLPGGPNTTAEVRNEIISKLGLDSGYRQSQGIKPAESVAKPGTANSTTNNSKNTSTHIQNQSEDTYVYQTPPPEGEQTGAGTANSYNSGPTTTGSGTGQQNNGKVETGGYNYPSAVSR